MEGNGISISEGDIVIVDDHPVFRDGLSALVHKTWPRMRVLTTETLEDGIEAARSCAKPPLMLVVDLFFARKSIRAELPSLRAEFNRTTIVVISMADDNATVDSVLSAGVNGFISKSVAPTEVIAALQAVMDGEIVAKLPSLTTIDATHAPSALSVRQLAVLKLLAQGKSNKEIALALGISPFTVRIHLSAAFRVLGVTSRTAALAKGISEGILEHVTYPIDDVDA